MAKAFFYCLAVFIGIVAFALFCHASIIGMLITVLGCGLLLIFKR